jgi:hypothetical protein
MWAGVVGRCLIEIVDRLGVGNRDVHERQHGGDSAIDDGTVLELDCDGLVLAFYKESVALISFSFARCFRICIPDELCDCSVPGNAI